MSKKEPTEAYKKFLEQIDRLNLDDKLRSLVCEGVSNWEEKDIIYETAKLKKALDALPGALEDLRFWEIQKSQK